MYVFTDISFLDSQSPFFFKVFDKALEIIPKYARTKAQSWP